MRWLVLCTQSFQINLRSLRSSISASFHARNCLKNFAYRALVFYAFSFTGLFSIGEAFSEVQITELCILCRAGLLSKQEYAKNESDWKQELVNIDRKVKALTLRRNLHQARAERLEDDALRWQSYPDLAPDTRSAWKRFEEEKTLVNELQKEIDRLQQRKVEILKEHNL